MCSKVIVDIVCGLTAGGALVVLLICGIAVSRPNFHGVQFEKGACELTTRHIDIEIAPLRSCDCSEDKDDHCTSYYPCVNAYGIFYFNGTETPGTFHFDYQDLRSGCLFVPPCLDDYNANMARVRYAWHTIYSTYEDHTYFTCWGKDNYMYFWNDYTLAKAYMGLFIPLGLFVVGMTAGLLFGSNLWRQIFCFPIRPLRESESVC